MLENPEDYNSSPASSTFTGLNLNEPPFMSPPPPSPPLPQPEQEEEEEEDLMTIPSTPTRTTKIQFNQDKDGMMLESSCVMPKPNDYVPIPSNPKKIRYYEKNDGISLDATPQQSNPSQPNPFRQLESYKQVSFVQDSSGNMVLVKTKPTILREVGQVASEVEQQETSPVASISTKQQLLRQ